MFLDLSLKNEYNCQITDVFKKTDKLLVLLNYTSMVVLTLSMTKFLSSNLISDNWKYPKASTLPTPSTQNLCALHLISHIYTIQQSFTFILDFSRVLGISCSSSKQTSFTSKLTGSYWNPTKGILLNNCYLFVVTFKL